MIYIVMRHDFDSWENDIFAARIGVLIGYSTDEDEAHRYRRTLEALEPTRREWDGDRYPHFHVIALKDLAEAAATDSPGVHVAPDRHGPIGEERTRPNAVDPHSYEETRTVKIK
jgi:hypothetical protein